MERYKNLGGNSSVIAFEIAPNSITVQFSDGWKYIYTTQSAGDAKIAEMQRLATFGRGLNSYIGRVARNNYAKKWR